jgi:signal transduction histidine kinase
LETVGKLADGIAHELNTPIQYIGDNMRFVQQAFTDLTELINTVDQISEQNIKSDKIPEFLRATLEKVDAPYLMQEVPRALEESLQGTAKISRIVRSMSDYSQTNGGNVIPTDLNQAVQTTLMICQHEWKNIANIQLELDPALPLFACIPCEINEVIQHLLSNAVLAVADSERNTPQNGGQITLRTFAENDCVNLEIEDNGVGIPDNIRDRIFDQFFTTRPVGTGTGQGLSICHALVVTKYSGTIHCKSEVGKGSKFVVRVPISHMGSQNAAQMAIAN